MPMTADSARQVFLHPGDRRKRQRKLYGSRKWERVRATVLERDGYVCQIGLSKCRKRANVVDHIIRPEEGGAEYDPANLRAACRSCNMRRHDAAYFREKADAAATPSTWTNPYAHRAAPAAATEPWPRPAPQPDGRPSTADGPRFLAWARQLHGVGGEPADHGHPRWAPVVTVTARGEDFHVCPPGCDRPVRWESR